MTTTIDGVFVDLTGSLARSGISAASFAELSDDESENTHRAIAQLSREVAKYVALSAANVACRSDWALGREGLARKKGYGTAEDYVQALGGGGGSTKADTRRLIEAGTMAAEAETARARQEQADTHAVAHPESPPVAVYTPWFAPLGSAVTDGTLSTDAATAIRRGLGEPAIGVTEEMLADAVVALIAECRTVNADQAAKVARQCRDSIDAAGVASRADAMRARQYLRVWDKPDGMLHGSFELDPENGSYFKDFLLQITGPRQGGPRFVEKGEKERAQRIIADPRSNSSSLRPRHRHRHPGRAPRANCSWRTGSSKALPMRYRPPRSIEWCATPVSHRCYSVETAPCSTSDASNVSSPRRNARHSRSGTAGACGRTATDHPAFPKPTTCTAGTPTGASPISMTASCSAFEITSASTMTGGRSPAPAPSFG
ncbi:DUF222 domain-containing protein [Cryobacterium psychrophilum]|nr:DUF222 domain-containing protein [Cryobacterium psychrophilum]